VGVYWEGTGRREGRLVSPTHVKYKLEAIEKNVMELLRMRAGCIGV
jgi:hypothetical protein